MLKLLHLADVHLGATFRVLGEQGAAQRRQVEQTFTNAIGLAIDEGVQLVLIAGDLFDSSKPTSATIDLTATQLHRLADAGIGIALIAGNHDVTSEGLVPGLERLRRAHPGLITYGQMVEAQVLPDLDLTVVGRSADPAARTSPLAGWPRGRTTTFALGLAHGSSFRAGQVEGPGLIHPHEILELGLDYLALGDWHSATQILPPPTAAWYAGTPELVAFNQDDVGHVLLIELPTPGAAQVRPCEVGHLRYRSRELNAGDVDESAVRRLLEEAADPKVLADLVLTGLVPIGRRLDVEALTQDFSGRFFRLRIQNRTQPYIDDAALAMFPEETVIGRFVRLMQAQIAETATEAERAILAEALQVGVAVLQGKEVLA